MTIDRAIEILDPAHREQYESIDPVNEACRIGMNALKQIRDGKLVEVVRCRDCANFRQNAHGVCWCDEYGGAITPEDYCSRAVTDKPSRVKIPWEAD